VAANVGNAPTQGNTALHLCAAKGLGVEVLVRVQGVDIDRADRYGRSALVIAAEEDHLGAVEVLLRSGADVNFFANYRPSSYATALASAVFNRNESITELLLCTPGINVEQPLLLGLPDAPTARHFVRTKSLLRLFVAHDRAQAASVRNGLEESREQPEFDDFCWDSMHFGSCGSHEAAGRAVAQKLVSALTSASCQCSCFTGLVTWWRGGKV